MLKREIQRQLLPIFFFLLFVSILHWQLKLSLAFFWLGALIGSFLLHLDQLVYCFFQSPHEFSSQRISRLWEQKDYRGVIVLLLKTQEERTKLVFHSVLFQIIILIASFFVLTSSASLLGKGVVMGLFLQSLVEQGREFREKGGFNSWFWQFSSAPEKNLQVFYFVFMLLIFLFFSFFWV